MKPIADAFPASLRFDNGKIGTPLLGQAGVPRCLKADKEPETGRKPNLYCE